MKVTFIDLFELIFTYKLASNLQEKRFSVGPLSHRVMAFLLYSCIVGVPQGSIVGPLEKTHTLPRNDLVISHLSKSYWGLIEKWEAYPNPFCAPWRWSMCRFVVQIKKAMLNVSDKLFHLTLVVPKPVRHSGTGPYRSTYLLFSVTNLCSIHFTQPQFVNLENNNKGKSWVIR